MDPISTVVWVFVITFSITAVITIGGIVENFKYIIVPDKYLKPLYAALLIEISVAGVALANGILEKLSNHAPYQVSAVSSQADENNYNATIKTHVTILDFLSFNDSVQPNFHSLLQNAKHDVTIQATSFNVTVESEARRNEILDALKRGVDVTIFGLNPKTDINQPPFQSYGDRREIMPFDLNKSATNLQLLVEEYKRNIDKFPGQLKVYYFRHVHHGIVFGFDMSSDNPHIYYVPYFFDQSARELPGYIIQNRELSKKYMRSFKELEKYSERLQSK